MDERMIRAMVAAGAIRKINIIASGARFHIEARTPNGAITAETTKGKVRTWVTLDAAAKWVRALGIGGRAHQPDALAAWSARVVNLESVYSALPDGQSLPSGNGRSSVLNVRYRTFS